MAHIESENLIAFLGLNTYWSYNKFLQSRRKIEFSGYDEVMSKVLMIKIATWFAIALC